MIGVIFKLGMGATRNFTGTLALTIPLDSYAPPLINRVSFETLIFEKGGFEFAPSRCLSFLVPPNPFRYRGTVRDFGRDDVNSNTLRSTSIIKT